MVRISGNMRIISRQIYWSGHLQICAAISLMQGPNTCTGGKHSTWQKKEMPGIIHVTNLLFWVNFEMLRIFQSLVDLALNSTKIVHIEISVSAYSFFVPNRPSMPSSFCLLGVLFVIFFYFIFFKFQVTSRWKRLKWKGKYKPFFLINTKTAAFIPSSFLDFLVRNEGQKTTSVSLIHAKKKKKNQSQRSSCR